MLVELSLSAGIVQPTPFGPSEAVAPKPVEPFTVENCPGRASPTEAVVANTPTPPPAVAQRPSAYGEHGAAPSLIDRTQQCLDSLKDPQIRVEQMLKDLEKIPQGEMTSSMMAKFMGLQIGVQSAGLKIELVSKTVETVTNGINTLSRTQT